MKTFKTFLDEKTIIGIPTDNVKSSPKSEEKPITKVYSKKEVSSSVFAKPNDSAPSKKESTDSVQTNKTKYFKEAIEPIKPSQPARGPSRPKPKPLIPEVPPVRKPDRYEPQPGKPKPGTYPKPKPRSSK